MIIIQSNYLFTTRFILKRGRKLSPRELENQYTISKSYIYALLNFGGLGITETLIEMHTYRIHQISKLLLKKVELFITKKCKNYQVKELKVSFIILFIKINPNEISII
jgi:hypothetical protein